VHRLLTAAQHSGRQRHRFQPHDRTPWWPGAQRPCVGGRRTAGRRQRQQTSRRQVEHLVDRRHHHAPATDRGTALRSATTTGSPAACPSGPRGGPVLNSPASVGAVPTEGRTSRRSSSTTTHWLMAPAEHPLVAAAPAVSRSARRHSAVASYVQPSSLHRRMHESSTASASGRPRMRKMCLQATGSARSRPSTSLLFAATPLEP
jgi:hypothetical protein